MITLIHFPRAFGIPNPSPFCMKVEILMKMAGLPYEEEIISDPRKGPKGKLPFIRDGGEVIGDSDFIERHIAAKYGFNFDAGLSEAERATGHAFARLAEEHLYWGLVHSRWNEPHAWPQIRKFFFGDLPPVIRCIAPTLARKQVRRDIYGHGMGHHSPEEIYALGVRDIDAIAAQLGDKAFLMAEEPKSADASVYPVLQGLMIDSMRSRLMNAIEARPNLAAYVTRCRERWFADLT